MRVVRLIKVNIQDVNIMYVVDELIKYLPDEKTFGCAARYHAHLKHHKDMHWSLMKMYYLIFKTKISGLLI